MHHARGVLVEHDGHDFARQVGVLGLAHGLVQVLFDVLRAAQRDGLGTPMPQCPPRQTAAGLARATPWVRPPTAPADLNDAVEGLVQVRQRQVVEKGEAEHCVRVQVLDKVGVEVLRGRVDQVVLARARVRPLLRPPHAGQSATRPPLQPTNPPLTAERTISTAATWSAVER